MLLAQMKIWCLIDPLCSHQLSKILDLSATSNFFFKPIFNNFFILKCQLKIICIRFLTKNLEFLLYWEQNIFRTHSWIILHSLKKSEAFQSFDVFSNIHWRFNELHTPRSYLRQIYGAIYMLGLLCGSTIMGFISDKYGRVTGTFYQ